MKEYKIKPITKTKKGTPIDSAGLRVAYIPAQNKENALKKFKKAYGVSGKVVR